MIRLHGRVYGVLYHFVPTCANVFRYCNLSSASNPPLSTTLRHLVRFRTLGFAQWPTVIMMEMMSLNKWWFSPSLPGIKSFSLSLRDISWKGSGKDREGTRKTNSPQKKTLFFHKWEQSWTCRIRAAATTTSRPLLWPKFRDQNTLTNVRNWWMGRCKNEPILFQLFRWCCNAAKWELFHKSHRLIDRESDTYTFGQIYSLRWGITFLLSQ